MKINIVKIKEDDLFIIIDGKAVGRSDDLVKLLKRIGEITGNEIVYEKFPGDFLFKVLSEEKKFTSNDIEYILDILNQDCGILNMPCVQVKNILKEKLKA
jgi:hypothetical protein